MSASDALATLQLIHTAISKVRDNQDELKSLSRRLQFIVQSLEESRRRDVIRDAEYEDSLSAVFELITRTERVTRRMLRRSLGDRTWNAGDIANDLRRLNEDVQTFLSVHTIRALDLVQTAQTRQQSYLVSSVEEIIAKIAEIDVALSKAKPAPISLLPAQAMAMTMQYVPSDRSDVGPRPDDDSGTNSNQLIFTGSQSDPPMAKGEGSESRLGIPRSPDRKTTLQGTARSPPIFDAGSPAVSSTLEKQRGPMDKPDILLDRLRTSNIFKVAIAGLQKSGDMSWDGRRSLEATFTIPGGATVDQIKDIVEQGGYRRPAGLIEDSTMILKVTKGGSNFDATAQGGLQISQDEPLLWWMNRYDEYHGITAPIPMRTEVEWARDSLKVDGLTIRCHRTLRVPDGDEPALLPPNMGPFPLFPVAQLGPRVPDDMKKRGGFIMPMFRREALWISFSCSDMGPAVKVSVGGKYIVNFSINQLTKAGTGVNAVSGSSASDPSPLDNGPQDYIVAGEQPWIDGIVTGPDVVRQFVVTEMHKGYTVEEQVTGEAKVGGLQFDIYPRRHAPSGGFYRTKTIPGHDKLVVDEPRLHNVTATPEELGLAQQTIACVIRDWDVIRTSGEVSWILSEYARRSSSAPTLWAKYPGPFLGNDIPNALSLAPVGHDPDFMALNSLGIAAGGMIKQKIYRDKSSVRVYNEHLSRRLHIHIVTPEVWEDLIGVLPPITPITRDLYARQGIPWFKLFDDYVESITEASGALTSVRSLSELDSAKDDDTGKTRDPVVDPDAPPPCFQHSFAVSSGSKCSCGVTITKFVGMKQPLPQLNSEVQGEESDDGMHHWTVKEIEQVATHAVQYGKVVVIHRPEDNVSPLQQKDPVSPTTPYWQTY